MQNNIKSTINNFINRIKFLLEYYKKVKSFCEKKMNTLGKKLGNLGVSANIVTVIGFIIGLFAINFLTFEHYFQALICILINRLFDMLDGSIARATKVTKFGVFIDILFDYIFYGVVIFGFAFARQENTLAAAFMLLGFLAVSCAVLAYAAIDYQYPKDKKDKKKTPFYLTGIVQGGDIFVALVAACLFPSLFVVIAAITGIFCFVKAFSLIVAAYYQFVVQENND